VAECVGSTGGASGLTLGSSSNYVDVTSDASAMCKITII